MFFAARLVAAMASAQAQVQVPGSCTACIAGLDVQRGTLEAANLGDSGCRVVRGGRVVFSTTVSG